MVHAKTVAAHARGTIPGTAGLRMLTDGVGAVSVLTGSVVAKGAKGGLSLAGGGLAFAGDAAKGGMALAGDAVTGVSGALGGHDRAEKSLRGAQVPTESPENFGCFEVELTTDPFLLSRREELDRAAGTLPPSPSLSLSLSLSPPLPLSLSHSLAPPPPPPFPPPLSLFLTHTLHVMAAAESAARGESPAHSPTPETPRGALAGGLSMLTDGMGAVTGGLTTMTGSVVSGAGGAVAGGVGRSLRRMSVSKIRAVPPSSGSADVEEPTPLPKLEAVNEVSTATDADPEPILSSAAASEPDHEPNMNLKVALSVSLSVYLRLSLSFSL